MTEQRANPVPTSGTSRRPAATERRASATGILHVDEVMRAVGTLEERPLEEHIGVFEAAQAQLRQALDIPTDPTDPA